MFRFSGDFNEVTFSKFLNFLCSKVTHKDILQFGENINKKAEQIQEKRLQRALALTKAFKTKEENKDRAKLRKETKKENTKKLALIKRDQMHENTIVSPITVVVVIVVIAVVVVSVV